MQSTVPWRREFLSGAIAAVAFLAIYFVVRFIWQIPALPEAVIEGILNFIPPALFEAVIQIFGSLAKTLNFYAILIGMVGAGGVAGLLYGRLLALIGANESNSGGTPTALLYGLGFGGLLWLVHAVTISPFAERGFFGMDASSPVIAAVAIDIIAYLAFGFVLAYVRQPFVVETTETASEGRVVPSVAGALGCIRTGRGRRLYAQTFVCCAGAGHFQRTGKRNHPLHQRRIAPHIPERL